HQYWQRRSPGSPPATKTPAPDERPDERPGAHVRPQDDAAAAAPRAADAAGWFSAVH
ncbi:unnamed protein product, partial [Prorocentrum cordatum]